MTAFVDTLADGAIVAKRNLIKVKRVPELLVFTTIQLFAYAISWIMAYVGLIVPTPEVVQNASFVLLFPATSIANTFVPTDGFPTVLRTIADWNPVSTLTQATRELFGNTSPGMPAPQAWSIQHPVVYTLLWVAGILAVFVPLAPWQYKRAAGR